LGYSRNSSLTPYDHPFSKLRVGNPQSKLAYEIAVKWYHIDALKIEVGVYSSV